MKIKTLYAVLMGLIIGTVMTSVRAEVVWQEDFVKNQAQTWRQQTWAGKASFSREKTGLNKGGSVKITSTDGADAAWFTQLDVQPFSQYRLTCRIKTDGVSAVTGEGALINLYGTSYKSRALTGTHDWRKVVLEFATHSRGSVQLNCLFGGWGTATGTAWYDRLELEHLSSRTIEPKVTINPVHEMTPISDYIYGQFIEHLGHCIYGGIWAEMLYDRKFYYPITKDYAPWEKTDEDIDVVYRELQASPWQMVGPPDAVTMVKSNVYSGEHTPQVRCTQTTTGIAQETLGLVVGRRYVGRIVLAGQGDVSVSVALIWGPAPEQRQTVTIETLSRNYQKFPLAFEAQGDTHTGRLEITGTGKGYFRIGAVSLMPADNIKGWRRDVVQLMRELKSPVYRWPGGNFVSGYDWKDGIGDPDQRPTRKNPAWKGLEYNDVGLHEFMELCRMLETEPFVAVNTGLGEAESAAEEVQYCNGSVGTPMGRWRAQNGHPEPFKVTWWAVGNEMYGGWQLGHMPLADYVKKHNLVAEALWAEDPSIQLIAVGATGKWSQTMLSECADHMNLLSEHIYSQTNPDLLTHANLLAGQIRSKAQAHRRYLQDIEGLADKDIRIAMDEWNHWYGPHIFGELGTRYFLKDALGVAVGLHEFFRNSDVYYMANYAQTVNVIGCIKTTKTASSLATTGLALKLYRHHFGSIPLQVKGAPEPLDVVAALSADRRQMMVAVVNPTQQGWPLQVTVHGVDLSAKIRRWVIEGHDPYAYNEPGKPAAVVIKEDVLSDYDHGVLEVSPVSITLYQFGIR